MTPDERQMLTGLFERIRSVSGGARDRDAEAFIADAVRAQPYAPYVMSQTVLVQEEAMKAAAQHIEQLEAKVKDLEANADSAKAGSGSFLGGLGKSIFGTAEAPRSPVANAATASPSPWGRTPAPQMGNPGPGFPGAAPYGGPPGGPYAAQGAPPMQAAAGGSFLKSAMGTAAGVAGGMMLANSLGNMFGGHGGGNNSQGHNAAFDSSQSGERGLLDQHDHSQNANHGTSPSIDDGLPGNSGYSAADYDAGSDNDSGGGGGSDVSDA